MCLEEISSLTRKLFELQAELTIERKQQQSVWYKHGKKQRCQLVMYHLIHLILIPMYHQVLHLSSHPDLLPFPPQSPTQLASSNPSNGQLSHAGERILSEQEESSTPKDTVSEHCDIELIADDSNSSSNL